MKRIILLVIILMFTGCSKQYYDVVLNADKELNIQIKRPGKEPIKTMTPARVYTNEKQDMEVTILDECYDKKPIIITSSQHKPNIMQVLGLEAHKPILRINAKRIDKCKTRSQLINEQRDNERKAWEKIEKASKIRRQKEKEERERFLTNLKRKAKKRGYKDCIIGVRNAIRNVYLDNLSIKDAKKYLIFHDFGYGNDDPSVWRVSNVAGKYVIYYMKDASKPNQFALLKEKNKFYGTGKSLKGDYFVIEGMSKFVNYFDAKVEVIVLKSVDFK